MTDKTTLSPVSTTPMYQVDAFAADVFAGNPAAVVPLKRWPDDRRLQQIANENNLSETAFICPVDDEADYQLRWFTPAAEVDLCGHATLATAHVLFEQLGFNENCIRFDTRSGILSVRRLDDGRLELDFPAATLTKIDAPKTLLAGLGLMSRDVASTYQSYDYLVVVKDESQVRTLAPDMVALRQLDGRGVVVTAPGQQVDFVSRCFFPKLDVDEDPVTGSAHCELAPLWQSLLCFQDGKPMQAVQLSAREGQIECVMQGDRVLLRGRAHTYMSATLHVSLN